MNLQLQVSTLKMPIIMHDYSKRVVAAITTQGVLVYVV